MPTDPTAADRLVATMAAAIEQYQRETPASTTEEERDDPLGRSYLRWLAKRFEARLSEDGPDQLLAQVAAEFTLLDARIVRVAAEAVTAAAPALVLRHFANGMAPPAIAREIGLTESRIYGIIREARKNGWVDPRVDGNEAYAAAEQSITRGRDSIAAEAYLAGVRQAIVHQDAPLE